MKPVRLFVLLAAVFVAGVALGAVAILFLTERQRAAESSESVPRRCEATVYLPLHDNNDRPFLKEKREQAISVFVVQFGGATLTDRVEGCWRDGNGAVRYEPIQLLVVSFEPWRLDEFRHVLEQAGRLLDQEEMYARIEEPRILRLPITGQSSAKDR
jgi:hypothetical protein